MDEMEGKQSETSAETGKAETTGNEAKPAPDTFTQEQVNAIVKERLERDRKGTLTKLGLSDWGELESFAEKAKGYDGLSEKAKKAEESLKEASERLVFLENGLDPERKGDIEAILKGKGLALTDETVKAELPTHPEWAKKPQVPHIGADRGEKKQETEYDVAKRFYGWKD